jgi:hypothetical protein
MNFFLSLSYLSSATLNSFTHPLYNKYGTPTPKIAITPTVLGEKRKVLSTTSRAWPWSSTNWFGFTDVGSAPAIIILSLSLSLSLSLCALLCEVSREIPVFSISVPTFGKKNRASHFLSLLYFIVTRACKEEEEEEDKTHE